MASEPRDSHFVNNVLVRAALEVSMGSAGSAASTGDLHRDLVRAASRAADFAQSPFGRGAIRMLLAESGTTEVRALASSMLRRQKSEGPRALFNRAVAWGEPPRDTDVQLILSTVAGALMHRAFIEGKPLTDAHIGKLVDLVLFGASRGGPG